jgi:hypothetical protein
MKKIYLLFVILLLSSCTSTKYSAAKYEKDRLVKGCPTYGFRRTDNKYHYFDAPRIYQQTHSYKYGPWKQQH